MDPILDLPDAEIERGLSEIFQLDDPDLDDPGLSFELRRTLRSDWGFGSEDRISDPRLAESDDDAGGFYQLWFRRWDIEGARTNKITYGGPPIKGGFEDVRTFNRGVARIAIWVSVGYPRLVEAYDPDLGGILEAYSGILRRK